MPRDIDIRLNPAAEVHLQRIGREGNPLLIIDNLVLDAEDLVAFAAGSAFAPPQGTWYPGLNAPLPSSYLPALIPVLRPSLSRAFGIDAGAALTVAGFYALATWPLEHLGPLQRIPHYDQVEPKSLAIVHYLCTGQGGTGFFRHRSSGYESIGPQRRADYRQRIDAELETGGGRLTGFAGPGTPGFEMIGKADLAFNRAIIYPSNVLHCALFEGVTLSADPRQGRLTANSFVGLTTDVVGRAV
ncbi:MAG: DUF6445 family protein [Asticcacaulis sp.]